MANVKKDKEASKIGIILVNWNGLTHTKKCLESLSLTDGPAFDIVVVDNGSGKQDLEFLRSREEVTLIENGENLGFTGGNNVGIRYLVEHHYDIGILLNNDTTVEPDFLPPLVSALKEGSTGAVQPIIMSMQAPEQIWSAGGRFQKALSWPKTIGLQMGASDFDGPLECDWLTGCCLAFRMDTIERVGFLDDDYFALCEDVDWSLRAGHLGYRNWMIPSSKIYHYQGATNQTDQKHQEGVRSPFRQYLHIRNHLYLLRKYTPLSSAPLAYAYHFSRVFTFLTYYALRGRWKKFRNTLFGVVDGFGKFGPIRRF